MRKPRRNNRRSRRRTNRNPQRLSRIAPRTRHLRAPMMTSNLLVRLRWSDDQTTTLLSSWRFGLAQFWNQLPGYFTQYMTIYKMSRIVSIKVKVTVINTTSATPAEVVLAVVPLSDYSRTLAQAKLLPRAAIRYLSGSGGIDKVSLTKTANLNQWLGVDSRSIRDYQQSASEAGSTLALLPDTPVLALYVGGASTEPTLRVFITVDYDVEFFEPEYPGSVALGEGGPVPVDKTDPKKKVRDASRGKTRRKDENEINEKTPQDLKVSWDTSDSDEV